MFLKKSDYVSFFFSESCKWSLVERYGPCPPARDGHSAIVVGSVMYVFGGFEEESQRFGFFDDSLNLAFPLSTSSSEGI